MEQKAQEEVQRNDPEEVEYPTEQENRIIIMD